MGRVNLWRPEPKRRAGIVRPPVVPGVPLANYSNGQLAVRLARRSNLPQQSPGIAWARAMNDANRPEKDAAREAVLRLFTLEEFPHLKILTFPASEWRFERELLRLREHLVRLHKRGPSVTQIVGMEREEDVFRAAVANIPRGERKGAQRIRVVSDRAFVGAATAVVQTAHISGFYRIAFEDFALEENPHAQCFNGAWLDFNGHIGPRRLQAIERFWHRQMCADGVLVITIMNGRTHPEVGDLIRRAGKVETMLEARLAGSICEQANYYGDAAPMVQVVLRRVSGDASVLVGARKAKERAAS